MDLFRLFVSETEFGFLFSLYNEFVFHTIGSLNASSSGGALFVCLTCEALVSEVVNCARK